MIKEIIYFNDINLFNRCEVEARRQGITVALFIIKCMEKMLEKKGLKNGHKKPIDLWLDCENLSKEKGCKISDIIEAACQYELTPPEKKDNFWDKFRLTIG